MKIEEIKELRNKNLEIEKIISQYKMEIHDLVQEKNVVLARKDSVQLKKSLSKSDAVDKKAEKLINDINNRLKDLDVKILDKATKLEQSKLVVEKSKNLVKEEIDEVKKNPAVLQHYNNKLIEKNNEKINELLKKQERITDFKTLVNTFPGLKMNFKTMVICGKETRRIQKELDKVEQKISDIMKKMKEPNYKGSLLQDKRNLESEKSTLKKSLQETKIRYNEAKSLTIANMNTYSKYSKSFIKKELIFTADEMEMMANSGKVHYERKDNGDLDFDVNSVLDSQIKSVSRDVKNHQMTNEVLKDEINGISNFLVDKRAQAAEEARKAEEATKKQGKNKGVKKDPFEGIDLGSTTKSNPPEADFSCMDRGEVQKGNLELMPIPEKSRISMFFMGIAEWFRNRFKKPEKGEPEPDPDLNSKPQPIIKTTPVENIDLKDKDIEFLNELKVNLEYEKHNEEIMKYVARDNRRKEKTDKEK